MTNAEAAEILRKIQSEGTLNMDGTRTLLVAYGTLAYELHPDGLVQLVRTADDTLISEWSSR